MATHTHDSRAGADDAVACAAFERTLALVDGLLPETERAEAERHLGACATCAPVADGWSEISGALAAHFDAAAERARPDLARMADRVFAAVQPAPSSRVPVPVRVPEPAVARPPRLFARLFDRIQAPVALAAATAAIALALLPLLRSSPEPTGSASTAAVEAAAPGSTLAAAADEPADVPPESNDCVVRQVSFEGADGFVYRTDRGGMTVIWITEHDGA